MMNTDFEVYAGKTFQDICKEIVDRSVSKKNQLDTLYTDVRSHIKNANDVQVFLPRIKELMDVGVKNDEQLIKLAAVIQRLHSGPDSSSEGTTMGLTEDEKEQLIKNATAGKIADIKREIDVPLLLPTSSIA